MNSSTPTIVVVTYNRPYSLKRILWSLSQAYYDDQEVRLIISIDYSGDSEIEELSEAFHWKFGPKEIRTNRENLGLRNHILKCGELDGGV